MLSLLKELWTTIVNCYIMYSQFVHSILPGAIGDLAEYLFDLAIVILLVKLVSNYAFGTKSGDI